MLKEGSQRTYEVLVFLILSPDLQRTVTFSFLEVAWVWSARCRCWLAFGGAISYSSTFSNRNSILMQSGLVCLGHTWEFTCTSKSTRAISSCSVNAQELVLESPWAFLIPLSGEIPSGNPPSWESPCQVFLASWSVNAQRLDGEKRLNGEKRHGCLHLNSWKDRSFQACAVELVPRRVLIMRLIPSHMWTGLNSNLVANALSDFVIDLVFINVSKARRYAIGFVVSNYIILLFFFLGKVKIRNEINKKPLLITLHFHKCQYNFFYITLIFNTFPQI